MKSSSKRSIIILLSLSMIIASFLVYNYLIKPVYSEISELRGKITFLNKSYENYKSLNDQFNNFLSNYNNASGDQLSLVLPRSLNMSYSVGQALGLANMNNLFVQSFTVRELAIKPSGVPLIKNLGTLRMEFRLVGNYENLKSFFQNLETNLLIMNPISLNIENQTGSGDNYSVVVDSYYQAK